MANSLATLNGALVAQRALQTLLEEFGFLNHVVADFSPETALYNQVIDIKLPSAIAATDYSSATGYAVSDVTAIDVPLTINKLKSVCYGFDEAARSSTNTNLIELFARNAAQALGLAMMGDLLGLLTLANFSNSSVNVAANFNRAKVIAVGKKLNARKVPASGRYLLMNSDYAETLYGDSTVVANAGSPSDVVRNGKLGALHGFQTFEYAQLPTNGQSLAGVAGVPEALVIAARVPQLPDGEKIAGTVQLVTEKNTGLTMQVREWYDMTLGKHFINFVMMYGVAVGNSAGIERLTLV